MKEKLRKEKPIKVLQDLINKIDRELALDGYIQNLTRLQVLHKIASEDRCSEHLLLEFRDIQDINQLWIRHQKYSDPFLLFISLPLHVYVYCEEDLEIVRNLKYRKKLILHVDATGSIGRLPEGLESKKLFYYSGAIRLQNEILKLFRFMTTEHGIDSISTMLIKYRFFAIIFINWPFFVAVVVDWSWAFIHSFLIAWNFITLDLYLQTNFDYCEKKSHSIGNLILIKICYPHFMHIISRTIEKKFNKLKGQKKLMLELFSLLWLCRDLKTFEKLHRHLCIILTTKSQITKENEVLSIFEYISDIPLDCRKEIMQETENDNKSIFHYDIFFKLIETKSNYTMSPFYKKFNKITSKIEVQLENESINDVDNDTYSPDFLNHILTLWIPYLPF